MTTLSIDTGDLNIIKALQGLALGCSWILVWFRAVKLQEYAETGLITDATTPLTYQIHCFRDESS